MIHNVPEEAGKQVGDARSYAATGGRAVFLRIFLSNLTHDIIEEAGKQVGDA